MAGDSEPDIHFRPEESNRVFITGLDLLEATPCNMRMCREFHQHSCYDCVNSRDWMYLLLQNIWDGTYHFHLARKKVCRVCHLFNLHRVIAGEVDSKCVPCATAESD